MHDRIPRLFIHFAKGRVARDACVVDQHVNRPAFRLNFSDTGLARCKIRDIDFIGFEIHALLFHVLKPGDALGVAWRASGEYFIAHACKLDADCFAQTTHAASYDCHTLCHCCSPQ